MVSYPYTGSTTIGTTGQNITNTSISTNILIMVGATPVGAIQTLTVNEKRPLKMVDEVGTDGHIDSVPTGSTNITGSCHRIRFESTRIAQAFGRGFVHVHSQIYPFDIKIIDKTRLTEAKRVVTVLSNVWIDGIDYTFNVDNWIITENMSWQAEGIYSFMNSSGDRGFSSATNSTTRPIELNGLTYEMEADVGSKNRRGALDVGGLIDLAGEGRALC